VKDHTAERFLGFMGEPAVTVVKLYQARDAASPRA
jgi:K+-transporting ATPase c subunit